MRLMTALTVVALSVIYFSGGPALAGETRQSLLSECVPSEKDPCADIVEKMAEPRFKGRSIKRPSKAKSLSGKVGGIGLEPEGENLSYAPSGKKDNEVEKVLKGVSGPVSKAGYRYVNTRYIVRNYSPYLAYWRLFAVRNNNLFMWPSQSSYYTIRRYQSVSKVIRCVLGEPLGFGATAVNGAYWGLGADGAGPCVGVCHMYCNGRTLVQDMQ